MAMTPEAITPAPRRGWRRWRLGRWFLVAAFVVLGYGVWRQYDFRAAIKEAQALGWRWKYDDPIEAIQKDWHAAFRKATWTDGTRYLYIRKAAEFVPHARLVRRLAPKSLTLVAGPELSDLSALKGLSALQELKLSNCTGLTNVDALKGLPALQQVYLNGCANLSAEAVAALRAALPNIKIYADPLW